MPDKRRRDVAPDVLNFDKDIARSREKARHSLEELEMQLQTCRTQLAAVVMTAGGSVTLTPRTLALARSQPLLIEFGEGADDITIRAGLDRG